MRALPWYLGGSAVVVAAASGIWLSTALSGPPTTTTASEVVALAHVAPADLLLVVEPLASPGGKVRVDPAGLAVVDHPAAIARMRTVVSRLDRDGHVLDGTRPASPWGGLRFDVELLDTLDILGVEPKLTCTVGEYGACTGEGGAPLPAVLSQAVLDQIGRGYFEHAEDGTIEVACEQLERVGWSCSFNRTRGMWMRLWVAPLSTLARDDIGAAEEIDRFLAERHR